MIFSDPIADLLTRIRNSGSIKLKSVDIPGSKIKVDIAMTLKQEGYIRNYKFIKDNKQGVLRIYLKYFQGRHAIFGLERVSKPSRRVYVKSKDLKRVLNGMGVAILSTSKGILTDKMAKNEKVGGEYICKIW